MEEKQFRIKSLCKAIELIDRIAHIQKPVSLTELSELCGYPKSTVHGILSTLREYDVIEQKDENGCYVLGRRLFEWGTMVCSVWDINSAAHPIMEEISMEVGESACLSAINGNEVLVIDNIEVYGGLNVAARIGSRLPLNATSAGKLFLAYMSDSEIKIRMKNHDYVSYTPHTISNEEDLFNNLIKIRREGYAVEDGEYKIGLRSVSAPVFGANGKVEYAVTIMGMFRRVSSDEFQSAVKLICRAAERISSAIGYRGEFGGDRTLSPSVKI